MGKKITHIATVSLLICVLMLTACTLETSHNGALDGYWKLSSIDTLSTGGINDLTDASIFWSVQKNLLTVRDNNDVAEKEYVFSFNHTDSTLVISDGQLYDRTNGNHAIEDPLSLSQYGISSQPATFYIDHLTHRVMTLSTDKIRLSFKKF